MPRTATHSRAPNSRISSLGWNALRPMPGSFTARASRSCSRATTTSCRRTVISIQRNPMRKTRSFSRKAAFFFQRILEQGWVDAIRTLHPDAPMYTFWDYMRNRWPRDAGLRIDHLLLSAQAAKRLLAAGVDRKIRGRENASDHAPAWVVLGEEAKARRNSRSLAK